METQTPAQTQTETKYSKEHIEKNVTNIEKALDFANITDLREAQKLEYARARDEAEQAGKSVDEVHQAGLAAMKESSDAYVAETATNGNLDPVVAQDLDALVTKYTFASMSDDLWYNDQYDAAGNLTAKKGMSAIQEDLSRFTTSIEAKEEIANPKLDTLRDKLAKLSAKRQNAWGGRSKEYDELQQEYSSEVIAHGRIKLDAILNDPSISEEDKKVKTLEYIFAEQAELRQLSIQKLENSAVSKFIKHIGGGPTWRKVAYGVGIGAAGVVIGATAGLAVATAGVGIAAGATFGARVVKKYAEKDLQAGRGIGDLSDQEKAAIKNQSDAQTLNHFESAQSLAQDRIEDDIKAEQAKRRKAGKKALAIVATTAVLGGVGGYFAGQAIDHVADAFQNNSMVREVGELGDNIRKNTEGMFDKVPNAGASDGPSGESNYTYTDNTDLGYSQYGSPEENGYQFSDAREPGYADGVEGPGQADADTLVTSETVISTEPSTDSEALTGTDTTTGASSPESLHAFPAETGAEQFGNDFVVQPGEGGIHMFERLGLTEAQWYEIEDDLVKNFGNEFEVKGDDVWITHKGPLTGAATNYIKARFGI